MAKGLNIFDFSDYRAYLKAWLEAAKRGRTGNLSRLAEVAKVHATFFSHVLAGTKHLSLEQAALVATHLGLTRLEKDYFFVIIQLDRAGSPDLREYWQEKKRDLEKEKNKLSERFPTHHELSDSDKARFYSSWLFVAIWVSTSIEDGQSLTQISERFRLAPSQAEDAMLFLVRTGLCYEEKGLYHMGKAHVHVTNESPFVTKHHSNWRMKALQRMDFRDDRELFFTSPVSMSNQDFELLREKLNVVIKEFVATVMASPAEDLFCLNIDFFRTKS
jgi:uncharacterized protein (TIGR02147 family)